MRAFLVDALIVIAILVGMVALAEVLNDHNAMNEARSVYAPPSAD
jgi:hypothetical protein